MVFDLDINRDAKYMNLMNGVGLEKFGSICYNKTVDKNKGAANMKKQQILENEIKLGSMIKNLGGGVSKH